MAATYELARAFQPVWAERPVDERIEAIRKFRRPCAVPLRRAGVDPDLGDGQAHQPVPQRAERATARGIDFFLDHVADAIDDDVVAARRRRSRLEEVISHEPLGVVANISAWNYPYFVGSNVFVPALLTGNAVLYKPSELAALTGLAIAEMLWGAGVPEEVFGLVIGGGDVGAALVDSRRRRVLHRLVRHRQAIAGAVAGRMIPVQLELGGKDPVYVCDDVDVAAAADGLADGAFYNTGQSCCSVERIYVHAQHRRRVRRALRARPSTASSSATRPTRPPTSARSRAPPQLDVLEAQVADAVAKGATVVRWRRARGRRGRALVRADRARPTSPTRWT